MDNTELLTVLNRIAIALEQKAGISHDLGFGNFTDQDAQFVFVNSEQGWPWYMVDNEKKILIEHREFKGVIQHIHFRYAFDNGEVKYSTSGVPLIRLNVHVKADKLYILQMGADSWTAEDILASVVNLEKINSPVVFIPTIFKAKKGDIVYINMVVDGNVVPKKEAREDSGNPNSARIKIGWEALMVEIERKFPGLVKDSTKEPQLQEHWSVYKKMTSNTQGGIQKIKDTFPGSAEPSQPSPPSNSRPRMPSTNPPQSIEETSLSGLRLQEKGDLEAAKIQLRREINQLRIERSLSPEELTSHIKTRYGKENSGDLSRKQLQDLKTFVEYKLYDEVEF